MQDRFNIRIGAYDDDRDLSYGELMASSKFALVAPGTCLLSVIGSSRYSTSALFTLMCPACAWRNSHYVQHYVPD